jgi:uncharacterized membrane protein
MVRFLCFILSVQIAFLAMTALNALGLETPIFTQVISFIYLVFVPGIVILRLLRLHGLSTVETLLYSVGLSIAFLMLIGLLLNSLQSFLMSGPISVVPLTITMSITVLALSFVSYMRDRDYLKPDVTNVKNEFSLTAFALCLLPLLSIFGTYLMNSYGNNVILLVMLFILSLMPPIVAFNRIPTKLYPLAVFVTSISLLYHTSLITANLSGWDIHGEYYFANLVQTGSHWDLSLPNNYNAVLSITMLAPILSDLCKVSIVWIFKIIYPFVFSLVPLGLYRAFQKRTTEKIAFLSCFFFMATGVFFSEMVQLGRQEIASLFLVLLVMFVADDNLKPTVSWCTLLVIFGFSLIVSHYALSYIFLFSLFFAWLLLRIGKSTGIQKLRADFHQKLRNVHSGAIHAVSSSTTVGGVIVSSSFILAFAVFTLAWYTYVSGSSALTAIANIGNNIANTIFTEFFNPKAAQGLSLLVTETVSPLHEVNKALYLFFEFSIVIGFFAVVSRNRKMKFSREYLAFSLASLVVAFAGIGVPYFASALNTSRLFQITLFFLAPFCVIGGVAVFNGLGKVLRVNHGSNVAESSLKILSIFLLVFLLFNSGFIYETTKNNPTSMSLSSSVDYPRFSDSEVQAAKWIANSSGNSPLYGDAYGSQLLFEFAFWRVATFWGETKEIPPGVYVYLRTQNARGRIMWSEKTYTLNYTDIQDSTLGEVLNKTDKIYDNGGAEIYCTQMPP